MANASGWSSQLPSGTSFLRISDDQIRSHQSILENSLNQEHWFTPASASSLSAGEHRLGSARVFVDANSRQSVGPGSSGDPTNKGRLFFNEDFRSVAVLYASSVSTVVHGARPPGCRLKLSGDQQTIPILTWSLVTFANSPEEYDYGGFSSNWTNFIVPSGHSGRYLINANLAYNASEVTTWRFVAAIVHVGTSRLTVAQTSSSDTYTHNIAPSINLSAIAQANAGDIFELWTFHSSGTTVSTWNGASSNGHTIPSFTICQL